MENLETLKDIQAKWRSIIINSFFVVVAVLFVMEIVIYMFMKAMGYPLSKGTLSYCIIYIVAPTLLNLLFIFVAKTVVKKCKSDDVKNFAVISCLLAMCFVVATIHGFFLMSPCIFVLPIAVSLMFENRKLLGYATGASIVLQIVTIFTAGIFDDVWELKDRLINGMAIMAFIMVAYVIYLALWEFQKDKHRLLEKNIENNREMKRALKVDTMTGLYNHTEFYNRMAQYYKEYDGEDRKLTIAVLDVDFFKRINDNYGHERGDAVLIKIAGVLQTICDEKTHIFRYGGEEFAIIDRHKNASEMKEQVDRIIRAVNELHFTSMPEEIIGISGGVYEYKGDNQKIQDIFKAADSAMYSAKNAGRNRCMISE